MIQNQEIEIESELEQQQRGEQLAASRYLVVHNHQIVRIKEPEHWFSIPPSPSPGLHASSVSFITDWADS